MPTPMNQAVIHIGRPDACAPHRNMDKVRAFREEHPTNPFICVLWDEKDASEVKLQLPEGAEVYHWKDDAELMGWLLDRLNNFVGAQIVGPRWYECADKHETPATYDKLIEKCTECGEDCILTFAFQDRIKSFADVFRKAVNLANFDTRSGEFLKAAVNPLRNVALNMPYALGCEHEPPLDVQGKWRGKPALLCAAGPSLEDSIPHLIRLQEQCVILCVARSYKLLREHGIRVDYVLSVEMFPWDAAVFDGLRRKDVGQSVLAYATVCANETVKKWPGRRTCMWDAESASILDRKGWILGGNSVAHHMLNFAAQTLECEPLILVGVDLAYSKPRTHAEGTNHEWPQEVKDQDAAYHQELWVPSTGKGPEHQDCHRVQVALPGGKICGVEVRSSPAYQNFANLFTILISRHGKKVWNACPNGQRIEGALYLDLAEFRP